MRHSVLLDPDGSPRLIARLLAMHGVIRHRGPDGEGFLLCDDGGNVTHATQPDALKSRTTAPRVGFAFRRLKICDLSTAADQPMGSADGKTWIVFNGEIYNFRELRSDLRPRGMCSAVTAEPRSSLQPSKSGAKTVSLGSMACGPSSFSIAPNRLVVSRDRFGIKPLYWTIDDSGALLLAWRSSRS